MKTLFLIKIQNREINNILYLLVCISDVIQKPDLYATNSYTVDEQCELTRLNEKLYLKKIKIL